MHDILEPLRGAAKQTAVKFPPARSLVHFMGKAWGQSKFRDLYSQELPSSAAAFNIFKGEWSSAVPNFETGTSPLFDDDRIKWLETQLGSFQNKRVLELGPLEGGHTRMMEAAGASVIAIEANQRSYLRCLVIKNAFDLKSEFLYGDFRPYLEHAKPRSFDFVSAIGVLYHMAEPVKLLHDIARVTDAFGVWTHYYDCDNILGEKQIAFDPKPHIQAVEGKSVEVYRQHYLRAITKPTFSGGIVPTSSWITKNGLLQYVEDIGFEVKIGKDDPHHPNGPSILFFARRK